MKKKDKEDSKVDDDEEEDHVGEREMREKREWKG
jgi:hypothetical protein